MSLRIEPLRESRVGEAGALLARAFVDDPIVGVFLGGKRSWRRRWLAYPAFFRSAVRYILPFGTVSGAFDGPDLVGVAAWEPPQPASTAAAPAHAPGSRPAAWLDRQIVRRTFPRGSASIAAGFDRLAAYHPTEPHWYLAIIGIDPSRQAEGLGTRLLEPVLADADRNGTPCYLETPFEATHRFYGRLGFEVHRTLDRPFDVDARIWTMVRAPRPA